MLGSDCGNVPLDWMEAYPGGPCSSRVRHVHPVRRSLKQPIIDDRSLATPVLPGNLYGRCFSCSRLWNRSVFMVFVQVVIPVSGPRLPPTETWREISSVPKSSRLQMVTLSQPATHPFRRGYAHPCQAVASAELIPVVYSKSLVWLTLLHRGSSTTLLALLAYYWLQLKRFSPWTFHKLSGLTGLHIDSPFKQMRR